MAELEFLTVPATKGAVAQVEAQRDSDVLVLGGYLAKRLLEIAKEQGGPRPYKDGQLNELTRLLQYLPTITDQGAVAEISGTSVNAEPLSSDG